MSAEIPLTNGGSAVVDDADRQAVLAAGPWFAVRATHTTYVRRTLPGKRQQTLHAFLMGAPYVDHINGDGLDNQRCNLRLASTVQNNQNRGRPRHNTSGFKGVVKTARKRPWKAQVYADGRQHYLGQFDTPEAAARAYDAAALRLHGPFARTNFPAKESA